MSVTPGIDAQAGLWNPGGVRRKNRGTSYSGFPRVRYATLIPRVRYATLIPRVRYATLGYDVERLRRTDVFLEGDHNASNNSGAPGRGRLAILLEALFAPFGGM
jgi:hypothetical protein